MDISKMTLEQVTARLAELDTEVRAATKAEDVDALTEEKRNLLERKDELEDQRNQQQTLEQRRQTALDLVFNRQPGTVVDRRNGQPNKPVDKYDTPEYRNAFMEYVCRNQPIPMEYRADAITTTTDASAVIPTTTLQEIIKTLESYGSVYAGVRHLNIQGGVEVPILTLKPEATWIGETTPSDDKKLTANTKISFSYYGLECKIAQTLLASVVTYEMFQREFVALATEAIIKALEIGVFTGNGSGKMMGVINDTRVPTANKITLSAANFQTYEGWKKNVFAKMKKSYRNGMFFMAQGTFDGYIDGMVDANGQPIGRVNYGIDGEEKYRFGGKTVETVEDDCIASYDDAEVGDVVAVFMKKSDYAVNSNMQMRVVKWEDHDTNEIKNKCILICDGKLLDANGVLLIKKGA